MDQLWHKSSNVGQLLDTKKSISQSKKAPWGLNFALRLSPVILALLFLNDLVNRTARFFQCAFDLTLDVLCVSPAADFHFLR